VPSVVLEAESEFALGASGTNSGIVHTGFDSVPGELETKLILRSAALRPQVFDDLGVPLKRCGAILRPLTTDDAPAARQVAATAATNGVAVELDDDGALHVPGESITDPVAYTYALLAAAEAGGAELRTSGRVERIARVNDGLALGLASGGEVACRVAVNCAGLYADEVARLAGDDSFTIYPRKGEFFVFRPPEPLERILLPVPTKRTKGVLVFPTIDGHVAAGPTAHDQEDKDDWGVRPSAYDEVMEKARAIWPVLEGCEPIASYAGLRPAGRGVNYLIRPAEGCDMLINVAAIRSTGLTASLAVGEHVAGLVAERGIALGPERRLEPAPGRLASLSEQPWWRRTAQAKAAAR
jgi:glycerol-3-phosphate dehydrogenase